MGIQVIPNLVQGVSQQAPQQRRDSQCEAQWDCINSAAEGCVPRPCGELVAVYAGQDWDGAFFGEFVYDDENYLLGFDTGSNLFGINLGDGTELDVSLTDASVIDYMAAGAAPPKDKLRGHVVEDYMFVANSQVVPAMVSTLTAALPTDALVFCKASNYNSTYAIAVKHGSDATVTASFKTHDTGYEGTDVIMAALAPLIDGVGGFSVIRSGAVMRIYRADGDAFTISTTDDNGDDYLRAFLGEAESYDKLPARAFNGMMLKVKGDNKVRADDFWVKWVGSPTLGVWQETVAPVTKTQIDAETMPQAWVRTALNTFEVRPQVWSTRIAGDETTAKEPSFIGKAIKDIFWHQQRLALLHRGGVVFSKTAYPFTLFPDTVQTILDTAPVDIKVTSPDGKGTNSLDFAVQAQEQLLLWAPKQQHKVSHGDPGFSQKTIATDPSSSYEFSPGVEPAASGPFLFFSTDVGQYVSLRAMQFSGGKLAGDVDLTAHLPSYIKSDASRIITSDTLRMVFVFSKSERGKVYLLNWTHDGQQFVQQAINTWRLPGGDILWASVEGNVLRLIQQRTEGPVFLKFNLTPAIVDDIEGARYFTRLDFRLDQDGVTGLAYDAGTGKTTFTLPYVPTDEADVLVVTAADKSGGYTRGRAFVVTSVVGSVVTVTGDLTGYDFYVGQRITAQRDESEFFIRTDNGSEPVDTLNIANWSTSLAGTCYTRMVITPENGDPKEEVFESRVLGTPSGVTGTPIPRSGDVTAFVGHDAKDVRVSLINDSPFPSQWQNAAVEYDAVGWKGQR